MAQTVSQVQRARVLREKEGEIIAEDLKRNPHLVPEVNNRLAQQRNMAARMATAHLPPVSNDYPAIIDIPKDE